MSICNFRNDPRTLLKTPKSVYINHIPEGSFYHFGVTQQIRKAISEGLLLEMPIREIDNLAHLKNLLTIEVVIDGFPIRKSSNLQFWPILCK